MYMTRRGGFLSTHQSTNEKKRLKVCTGCCPWLFVVAPLSAFHLSRFLCGLHFFGCFSTHIHVCVPCFFSLFFFSWYLSTYPLSYLVFFLFPENIKSVIHKYLVLPTYIYIYICASPIPSFGLLISSCFIQITYPSCYDPPTLRELKYVNFIPTS